MTDYDYVVRSRAYPIHGCPEPVETFVNVLVHYPVSDIGIMNAIAELQNLFMQAREELFNRLANLLECEEG